jgi:hypothetical protein
MDYEIEIIDSVEERLHRDGYGALTGPERLYFEVTKLLQLAYGPGLEHYFADTPEEQIQLAKTGLKEIGAHEMAGIIEEALAMSGLYLVSVRPLPWIFSPFEKKMEALTNRLQDLPYPGKALDDYARRNDARFLGPRTQLELWQSKVDRGVDTTPRYVSKVIDFEKEAEEDRHYSTRSCPNCGYPTPDYRPRCKRCDYPHGRA